MSHDVPYERVIGRHGAGPRSLSACDQGCHGWDDHRWWPCFPQVSAKYTVNEEADEEKPWLVST